MIPAERRLLTSSSLQCAFAATVALILSFVAGL